MQETRRARLQAVIQRELSVFVPREVKDPRIPAVTFTSVEVTPDASQATVFISIFGGAKSPEQMRNCLAGLTSAAGYLRRHLASILNVKHVPNLIFREDKGIENSQRVHELLKEISESSSEKK